MPDYTPLLDPGIRAFIANTDSLHAPETARLPLVAQRQACDRLRARHMSARAGAGLAAIAAAIAALADAAGEVAKRPAGGAGGPAPGPDRAQTGTRDSREGPR